MEAIDLILNQLHPVLDICWKSQSKSCEIPLVGLWRYLDKPGGHPVQLQISEQDLRIVPSKQGITIDEQKTDSSSDENSLVYNRSAPPSICQKQQCTDIQISEERVIIYFVPLIAKFIVNSEQGSYMYELQPTYEDEVTIIDQLKRISDDIPYLSQLNISQLHEGSQIVIKWVSTNHNQAYKIRSNLYIYYQLKTSETELQTKDFTAKGHNKQIHKVSLNLKKFYSSKTFLTQNKFPQQETQQFEYFRHLVDKSILVKRNIDWMTKENFGTDRYLPNQFVNYNQVVNASMLFTVHHILRSQDNISVVNHANLFQYLLYILNIAYQNIVSLQLNLQLFSTMLDSEKMILNILYFRSLTNKINNYYGKKDTDPKLRIVRPFINNKKNEFFTDYAFIKEIGQEDIERAIFDFTKNLIMCLSKQIQINNQPIQVQSSQAVFSAETDALLNNTLFNAAENMKNFSSFNDAFQLLVQQTSKKQKFALNADSVDLDKVKQNQAEETVTNHYKQYISELFSKRQNGIRNDNTFDYQVQQWRENHFQKMKQELLKTNHVSQLGYYASRQSGVDIVKSILEHSETDILNYQLLARRILLQRPQINTYFLSKVGFQILDPDTFLQIQDEQLNKQKQNIKLELGQVYGFEQPEISIKIQEPSQTRLKPKFQLSAKPEQQ
ncbi:Conserved_hypothetical protein [Hexamita inflata]|uniref:Uncharacterized protein n=2 Tax=Hexamita inflata TaxID=28002 RepID=A0AA86PBF5_9EUKA|nr:Conserved hypothetical protein [Hexamita inflata]